MTSLVTFKYDDQVLDQIRKWSFGTNWPAVYIIYNEKNAYVGETLDSVRRTEQHMQESAFKDFTDICLISDKTYNKSVILNLESFLIKYMSADGTRVLTNGNAGVVNHDYFYREAYEDEFKEIWNKLIDMGIVHKSILDIENSEIYKYSPYKTLNDEQQKATYEILHMLCDINNASHKTMVEVIGGAGTGKTILAVYLIKLLTDINRNKEVWYQIDDNEESLFIRKIASHLKSINNIGFVVPMVQLRSTIKSIFKTVDGLSDEMVYAPEEVVGKYFDLLVVDEAHRLYQRKHLPGQHLYKIFDKINRNLMGDSFTGTENDLTELDWIIRSSRLQIVFYDNLQAIRTPDIPPVRFNQICAQRLSQYYHLVSQMRCKGGNGYYEYVKKVLTGRDISAKDFQKIENYDLKVVDCVEVLFEMIADRNESDGLSRVVTGPGWAVKDNISINGREYHWSTKNTDWTDQNTVLTTIASIHKSQGFDLNYAGVIFGKEVFFDKENKIIKVNKNELRDNHAKSSGTDEMRQFVINIYLTLMTRGIKGTYVFAVNEELQEYLKAFFGQ